MGLGAGLLGVDDGVVVALRKPNADPPLDGPTLDASVGAVVAVVILAGDGMRPTSVGAAATGSAGAAAAVLFTVMFPNKSLDPDDGAATAAAGAGSAETEKLPSKSPPLSVDSVDTNAGAAGELFEGAAVLFIVIPPNISPPLFAVEVTAAGAGGAATGAGTSDDGPSKSNKLGASAATAGAAAAATPLLLAGDTAVTVPGATPSNPKTLFAGAFTDCLA
mmetsp:Transcript_8383/g.12030  ORF Transcript_8383/g.12030 Transcript_8383/m.12030 type:complete len:220 (-) Transcript_8383:1175-1834(-)